MTVTCQGHNRAIKKRNETSINVDKDTSKDLGTLVSKGVAPTKKWLVKCLVKKALEKERRPVPSE